MQTSVSPDAVVVSDTSFTSDDPAEIVDSNALFVNELFAEYMTPEEISADALRSYYVANYLEQVENGGFSQFVYNCRWNPLIVSTICEGLRSMQAERHLEKPCPTANSALRRPE